MLHDLKFYMKSVLIFFGIYLRKSWRPRKQSNDSQVPVSLSDLVIASERSYFGETAKSEAHRQSEGFFQNYCQGKGLDIGCNGDPIVLGVHVWEYAKHGDATLLNGLPDDFFDFVYSSHLLEHLENPAVAIKNQFRVLKHGGYLILVVPHRDLYEKRKRLPSRWAPEHQHFFMPFENERPCTIGVKALVQSALENFEIIYIKVRDVGHTVRNQRIHSEGEYSIECVVKKV